MKAPAQNVPSRKEIAFWCALVAVSVAFPRLVRITFGRNLAGSALVAGTVLAPLLLRWILGEPLILDIFTLRRSLAVSIGLTVALGTVVLLDR